MSTLSRLCVRSPSRSGGFAAAHLAAASACSRASRNITCSRCVRSQAFSSAARAAAASAPSGGAEGARGTGATVRRAGGAAAGRGGETGRAGAAGGSAGVAPAGWACALPASCGREPRPRPPRRRRRRVGVTAGCELSTSAQVRRAAKTLPHRTGPPSGATKSHAMTELTPMMRQYQALKDEHPHAILLFRLGDFFEAFFEDAQLVARELHLTLTSRPVAKGRRIPMCGIPHHALPTYLRRLIDRGHRVAICDQVEDPRQTRTLVRREVVRVVTPGTVIEDDLLTARENNFVAAVVTDGDDWGVALADVSTGEFVAAHGAAPQRPDDVLARWRPREIIVPDGGRNGEEAGPNRPGFD